jgi:hypothetical protein
MLWSMSRLKTRAALALFLALPLRAEATALGKGRFQALLQSFVEQTYQKGFRHLGDERDFDHGHLLSGADGSLVAVMWHTQELALYEPAGGEFGYVDPGGRNWLQWLDGRVENAARYERKSYPSGPTWDWFRASELPALVKNRTILDKMLDPRLVSVDPAKTVQYVFTRIDCGRASLAPDSADMRVVLPTREAVCLSLSR